MEKVKVIISINKNNNEDKNKWFWKTNTKKKTLKSLITFLNNWACQLSFFYGDKTIKVRTTYLKNS